MPKKKPAPKRTRRSAEAAKPSPKRPTAKGKDRGRRKPTRSQKAAAAKKSNRERAAERSRRQSQLEREIGKIPAVVNPRRRKQCGEDTPRALKTYFPNAFPLPFAPRHLEVIATTRQVMESGGLFALAMARGDGKSTTVIRIALLAILYRWRFSIVLLGSSQKHAKRLLRGVKTEIESNDLLLADFPEVCYPVRCLERMPARANGQTTEGHHTDMFWSGHEQIVLPTVAGQCGGVMAAVGMNNSDIRGTQITLPSGEVLRPDCFIGDDLQTAAVARNVEQVKKYEGILKADVMGMAGPDKTIAGVAIITVQRKGDLADRLLNRTLHNEWNGKRFRLVDRWPDNEKLWADYAEKRDFDLANGDPKLSTATEHYRRNRIAMDAGAVVTWPERKKPHELSALQSAYNLRLENPDTFDAEYQNDPAVAISAEGQIASPDSDSIVRRVGGYARGEVPESATRLFAGVDVQQHALFWMVAAVDESFSGWIVDYGSWPDQHKVYWTLRQCDRTIASVTGISSLEGSLSAAYEALIPRLLIRSFTRDDGATMNVERLVIDANWGPSTKSVYSFVRQVNAPSVLPFHGRGVTAKQNPFAARKKKAGEQAGIEWFVPKVKGTKTPRHVIADVNLIKSNLSDRLTQPIGESGAWQLFQAPASQHRMLADHLSAEFPIETHGRGRVLHEWMLRPGRDNHWLDCAVMIATAALMAGCSPNGTAAADRSYRRPKQRRGLDEAKKAA